MRRERPLTPDDLEERLLRFLLTEHRSSRRATLLLHELPVDERVAKGACMTDLQPLDARGATLRFAYPPQACKVREGDWMILNRGRPVGPEIGAGIQVIVSRVDPLSRTLTVEALDRGPFTLEGGVWTIDYLSSDSSAPRLAVALRDVLEAHPHVRELLVGSLDDADASPHAVPEGLDPSQARAAMEALSGRLTLIHGPPGTGKTKVLAAVVATLVQEGATVLVSAFTHRAIDNVLHALLGRSPGVGMLKLGRRSPDLDPRIPCLAPHRLGYTRTAAVVGATVYALCRVPRERSFDAVVIDEGSQLPLAHACIALARGRERFILAGDHLQLPPVLSGSHMDGVASSSVFAYLADRFPSRTFMLTTSYRLPPGLCRFPSEAFYQARLHSAHAEDPRLDPPRLPLREPEFAPLWEVRGPLRAVWVNHRGWGAFSPPEAEAVARALSALVVDVGIPPEEIAVVAPHRAQVRDITDRAWRRLGPDLAAPIVVDTVERMQGQERDVVVLSLTVSDPWFMAEEVDFILSLNRLNVSFTRARRLLVVIGSRWFFRVYPPEPEYLEAARVMRRLERELAPVSIDLTAVAHAWTGLPLPPRVVT